MLLRWRSGIRFGEGYRADPIVDQLLRTVVQRRKCPHQFAVLKFDFPAQVLAALKVEEPVEIDLRAVLLDLQSRSGVAVPADRIGRQLAIGALDLEALLFLTLRIRLVGGVGDSGPASSSVLCRKRTAKQAGNDEEA